MSGPTRANPYAAGLRAEARREVSERHRRAGMVGGLVTAKRHRGKHAAWAKLQQERRQADLAAGPAVGKG